MVRKGNVTVDAGFCKGAYQAMKIAVNCWVLRNKQLDGIGNFTVETLPRIIGRILRWNS